MVKCVVSSCPNREQLSADRGFSRAPKRFFSLPQDPARIKVWLAALREPDTKDWTESHVICEDHFLPEDISMSGVNPDAIPIMPPCLEEQGINVWPEDPEEDDDGWAAGEQANEESEGEAEEDAEEDVNEEMSDTPLPLLTPQFLELLLKSDRSLDLHQAAVTLQSRRRCLYDITAVLKGLDLVQKESPSRNLVWQTCPISSFLWPKQKMQKESEKMRLVEETLDGLIKSCAQQLFQMTDDPSNARYPPPTLVCSYVQNLPVFENQTVIVVKAPEETKLEVPAPKKDGIQIHLKSGSSPISVLACEVWPDGTKAEKGAFLHIQHSRIKTFPLQTDKITTLPLSFLKAAFCLLQSRRLHRAQCLVYSTCVTAGGAPLYFHILKTIITHVLYSY
uniref:THAP-type domain-containing protein n=1 Tax=Periophthalmus magnuspinnatus TaxID=409849 RepID=A0A3B3ZT95_9GOBI